jgi:cell division septum initiation protein DivIVA
MDILRILDELHEHAVERPRTFGPIAFGLDKDEVAMYIHKVRASLPAEVKQAVQTVRESDRIVETAREDALHTVENAKKEADRILAEARQDAERVIEQARIQQERMISESEILKLAKAQSEEIRNSADREATQTRRGAEQYAIDVLSQLEGVVGKAMTIIDRGKQEMMHPTEQPVALPRDRQRIGVS